MRRRGREGGSLGVARVRGRSLEGHLSLSLGVVGFDLCEKVIVGFLLLTFVIGDCQEILSVYLDCDCDCAFGVWVQGFWSDGRTFGHDRGRCVCDVEAILIASLDFLNVFVDVIGSRCVCVHLCLSSSLDLVSSGLWSCAISPTYSRHPSRVDSVCLAQTALLSIFPLALRLFAASSSHHHRHGSQNPLCFFSHRSPNPLASPSSLLSLSLAKLHYDYPHLSLDSSEIEYSALAHSCLAVPL